MKLKLLQEFTGKDLSLNDLFQHGLKTVQCTTEASSELKSYLISVTGKERSSDVN